MKLILVNLKLQKLPVWLILSHFCQILTHFDPFQPIFDHFDLLLQEEHPREPEHHHHSTPKIPVDPMRKKRAVSEEISHHRMRYAKIS